MAFIIDTGNTDPDITPKSSGMVGDFDIRFTNHLRADKAKRDVIANIETHESAADLREYMVAENLIIDAIWMYSQPMADEIDEAFIGHHIILSGIHPDMIS